MTKNTIEVEMLVLAADPPYTGKNGRIYHSGTVRIGTGVGQVNSDVPLDEYLDEKVTAVIDFELGFNSKKLNPKIREVHTA